MNTIKTGDKNYRAFVGAYHFYDIVGADQFNLLTTKGLRENNTVLDVGCGSLRLGRLLIPYLNPSCYFGVEPEEWLVHKGIDENLGKSILKIKKPSFVYNSDFYFSSFNEKFDYAIACSIFSHATQRQINECLDSINKVMHENSVFFASFREGDSNYQGEKWSYPEVIKYKISWFEEVTKQHGLKCKKVNWTSPHQQTWLVIVNSSFDEIALQGMTEKNSFLEYNKARSS